MFFQKPWAGFRGALQNDMLALHQLPALNLVANLVPAALGTEHLNQTSLSTLWSTSVNAEAQPVADTRTGRGVSVAFLQKSRLPPTVVTKRDQRLPMLIITEDFLGRWK